MSRCTQAVGHDITYHTSDTRQSRGLASTVRTDESEGVTGTNLEADVVYSGDICAKILLLQMIDDKLALGGKLFLVSNGNDMCCAPAKQTGDRSARVHPNEDRKCKQSLDDHVKDWPTELGKSGVWVRRPVAEAITEQAEHVHRHQDSTDCG